MRSVLLALGITFVTLGSVFTISPELLEHSPVGFEQRGAVHHIWHYMILIGGLSLLIGLLMPDRAFERIGLVGCGLPVLLNLAAAMLADDESFNTSLSPSVSGIGIALRVVVLALIVVRLREMREDR